MQIFSRNVMLFDRTISSIGWKILRRFNRFIANAYFYAAMPEILYIYGHPNHVNPKSDQINTITESFNRNLFYERTY